MNALRCLRALAPTPLTPTLTSTRALSLLSLHRPTLSLAARLATPGTQTAATPAPSSTTPDLMSKISASPAFAGVQIRCGPRDTYNPSHIVRKRRHGFLSRIRTKKGRKLLMRRLVKGRVNLSH